MRNSAKGALLGIGEALLGAWIGAILLLVVGAFIGPRSDPYPVSIWHEISEFPKLSLLCLVMVVGYSWWIGPVGAFYGIYLRKRFRRSPQKLAMVQALFIGGAFGLLTGILLNLTDSYSHDFNRVAFPFFATYCAIWSAWFGYRSAHAATVATA